MVIGFDGSRSFVKNKTGTENYAYQLLKHLAEIDKTNQYIIYLRPGNEVEKWSTTTSLRSQSGVTAERGNPIQSEIASSAVPSRNDDNYSWPSNFQFKMLEYSRLWTQFGLAKQTFKDKLDVLFVPSHTLPLIRKPGLKTVMTVHDLGAEYLPGMHQLKQRLYLGLMTKIQLKTATKLIAVSFATKKDLMSKIGLNTKQVVVVYEGVNSNSMNNKEIEKKVIDTEKGDQIIINNKHLYKNRYFLFVGTIQPRKNIARLIKAYAGFRNVMQQTSLREHKVHEAISQEMRSPRDDGMLPKLVLAGGKGWSSDEIFALPKKLGVEDSVIFTGRVADDDLEKLYKNALAFTFPSLFEGFGLPVLEAFSYGLPVITSNSSSLPEVAGKGGLLVDPTKTEEILDALLKIYDDKSLRTELAKQGEEQLKKFSWQKCAEETLKVLESV